MTWYKIYSLKSVASNWKRWQNRKNLFFMYSFHILSYFIAFHYIHETDTLPTGSSDLLYLLCPIKLTNISSRQFVVWSWHKSRLPDVFDKIFEAVNSQHHVKLDSSDNPLLLCLFFPFIHERERCLRLISQLSCCLVLASSVSFIGETYCVCDCKCVWRYCLMNLFIV